MKTMYARVKHMYHTDAWYATNDPVTQDGELFFTVGKPNAYKIGDGVSLWSQLPYVDFSAKHSALILYAAGWVNGVQMLYDANIVSSISPGSLRIAQSATGEQYTALCKAQPQVISQDVGMLTVRANGTAPTVDIPVELEVRI